HGTFLKFSFLLLYQSSISITEGSSTTLSCTYTGSPLNLHWFQQKPGSRPEFLMLIDEATKIKITAKPPDPRLSIRLHTSNKVDLIISSTAVSDSALYYCALQNMVLSGEGAVSLSVSLAFRTWKTCSDKWNNEFRCLPKDPEGEFPAIGL
uniref:Ig-like domain-containing protein n=1 Tax=Astyanax mexicanus TaxID=7994 RepID=A0A3B1JZ08_ASTMX